MPPRPIRSPRRQEITQPLAEFDQGSGDIGQADGNVSGAVHGCVQGAHRQHHRRGCGALQGGRGEQCRNRGEHAGQVPSPGETSDRLAAGGTRDEQRDQPQDRAGVPDPAASERQGELGAVPAHIGDEQMAQMDKADRIDHAGEPGQQPRQQQVARPAALSRPIAVDCCHLHDPAPLRTSDTLRPARSGKDRANRRAGPLVIGPGGYHFRDYRKRGLPFSLMDADRKSSDRVISVAVDAGGIDWLPSR